jgi:uncharacterized Zn ribbon protein
MADATIKIVCPKCKKEYNVPENLRGKKFSCKNCQELIAIEDVEDEWAKDKKGYVLSASDTAAIPRCPHCANELESEKQKICLKCGFNLRTRMKLNTRVLEAVTTGDRMGWLGPGFAAAGVALFLVLYILVLWTGIPSLGFMCCEWMQTIEFCKVYLSVGCAFGIFFLTRFAIHRLYINPEPPEVEVKQKSKK